MKEQTRKFVPQLCRVETVACPCLRRACARCVNANAPAPRAPNTKTSFERLGGQLKITLFPRSQQLEGLVRLLCPCSVSLRHVLQTTYAIRLASKLGQTIVVIAGQIRLLRRGGEPGTINRKAQSASSAQRSAARRAAKPAQLRAALLKWSICRRARRIAP